MADFRLFCCRLFQQHSLVKYRRQLENGRYELRILLVGSGSRMDTILQEVLVNGQLLDTDLYVTVVTGNAKRSAETFMKKSVELQNYIKISCKDQEITAPAEDCVNANLQYETLKKGSESLTQIVAKAQESGCNYVIVSTGKDPKNTEYAGVLAGMFGKGSVLSYVQSQVPEEEIVSEAAVCAIGYQVDDSCEEQLERIAYNLHYAYSKSANDRTTNKKIRAEFKKPYNYISNLEAAMHVQAKLECCGIDASDNHAAAEAFAKRMEEEPGIVTRLAALEHRRWMVEKMLRGFTKCPKLTLIYSGPDITTHDSKNKWHPCLVPCNETSALAPGDWTLKNAAKKRRLAELDQLDRLSIFLHDKCGEIAAKNRELIEESLTVIRNTTGRIFKDDEYVLASMQSMEYAISHLWQMKKSALPIYEGNFRTLLEEVSASDNMATPMLEQSLRTLDLALAPLKEFISFKDYKEQDRILIRQIPFALTHKKQPVLMKLMAEKDTDSLYTTCRLEPDCTIFVDFVASHNDYLRFKERLDNIERFLGQSYPEIDSQYHIILPEKLWEDHVAKLLDLDPDRIHVYRVNEINYSAVVDVLQAIAEESSADYLDVTNGHPLLMMGANTTGIPVIAHKAGVMMDIINASEITYPIPKKVITVQEMFTLFGTVLKEESDSAVLSDLSKGYKDFFDIAYNAIDCWDAFCTHVKKFYNKEKVVLPTLANKESVEKSFSLNTESANPLVPVLEQLEKAGYISSLKVKSNLDKQKTFSFKIAGESAGNEVLKYIHQLADHHTPTMSYEVDANENNATILCPDLRIKGVSLREVSDEQKAKFGSILGRLAEKNLLIDYVVDTKNPEDPLFSFQLATKDILKVINISGSVLEQYVYYSALLDAHFDDVEMGWNFRHSPSEDAPDNELDVICTKGISSLFISAKFGKQSKLKNDKNYLNSLIYEVTILADRFGLNAKSALAIPSVEQFQYNEQEKVWEFSTAVKKAYSRGVYLLGGECFEENKLGKVLDNIAEGREDWCDFLKPKEKP